MALKWRDLWALYCPELDRDELDRCTWLQGIPARWPAEDTTPVDVCDWLAELYGTWADEPHRKKWGQYFTPPTIARFMAELADPLTSDEQVLEPGAGLGILIAALAERIVKKHTCSQWAVVAYESDETLRPALALALGYTRRWLNTWNVQLTFEIRADDFILANMSILRPAPLFEINAVQNDVDLIIANPPYFKLPKDDPRVAIMSEVVNGQPNIYALFMAASAKMLQPDGQLVFITPRSFCSGSYFRQFRNWFFRHVRFERVHVFESRTDAFERDAVLQENIIFKGRKDPVWLDSVEISSSYSVADLKAVPVRSVPRTDVLDLDSPDAVLSIPVHPSDNIVLGIFARWPDRLRSMGIEISTGPVVPFRTTELVSEGDNASTAPLVWVQHVQRMSVKWPLVYFNKPQWIRVEADTYRLLVPNKNYVLIRRFSSKEENSRFTAAPLFKGSLPSDCLGIENHVNYLHRRDGDLSEDEVLGLAAFFNSRWVDRYFRVSSGNTQVNATDVRELPMPPLRDIQRIGSRLREAGEVSHIALVNQIVGEELDLPLDLSNGNGGHMPKIEEAKDLLASVGLPPAQRNEIAALTLLALADLTESDAWRNARRHSIRIHDMISFVEQNYRKRYAENTRETFRRQVLHQFEQARLVDHNPDDPSLPTNSPHTHYALSEEFLPVVRSYGSKTGQRLLKKFLSEQGTLLEVYQKRRSRNLIALKDAAGREYHLSPGKHNKLQVAVVVQFAPRFAPNSKLLYVGDTANKVLIMETDDLKQLGFPIDKHSKLPDVVLYLAKKNWLYLIEVVTSHGPVSPKRHRELERVLSGSSASRIYVTVFADWKEFTRHSRNIAWETEVWIAEAPDHLIHYNGDKFIGPHSLPASKKSGR